MNTPADTELLSAYASQGEEQAFREFVERHAFWVLGVAARAANGDIPLGEEIAQNVFCLAAKKAAVLASGRVVVAAWLHRTTLLTAANAVRGEVRRHRRLEQASAQLHPAPMMNEDESTLHREVLPHLDRAMDALREGERALLLQRFFERRSVAGMARIAGISEAACQKRLSRALQRLAAVLKQRKVAVSTVTLGSLLGAPPGWTAPAALVRSFGDAALLAPGRGSLSAFAVAAPVNGITLSYFLTAAAAFVAFATPAGLQVWENAKHSAAVAAAPVQAKLTEAPKRDEDLSLDPALARFSASLHALKPGDHEGLLELVLLTSNLPPESLPGAWTLLHETKQEGTIVRALFAHSAEVDLSTAVAAGEEAVKNLNLRDDVWHGIAAIWAVSDPDAYFARIAQDPAANLWPANRDAPRTWQQGAYSAGLSYLALARPDKVLKMLSTIPGEMMFRRMALNLWAQRDVDGAVRSLQSELNDTSLDRTIDAMVSELVTYRPGLALKVACEQVNPHFREREISSALTHWARVAPAEALASLAALPAEMRTVSVAQEAATPLFRYAPEETAAFAAGSPAGEFREEMLRAGTMYFIEDRENQDFPGATGLASQMAAGHSRQALFEKAMGAWIKVDASGARQWADRSTDFPAELKAKFFQP